MSANLKVVELLPSSGLLDVVEGLRNLADKIEAEGRFIHNIAWVADYGDNEVVPGMLGQSHCPGAEAHILFAVAMRQLEQL